MSSLEAARDSQYTFPGGRVIAALLIFAALLTIAYWLVWFIARSVLASTNTIQYYAFENAFPLADGWLAFSAIVGAIGLLRRQRWGVFWTIIAAGSGIYLGCMDVLFDLENGIYLLGGAAIVEIIINFLTFSLGIIGLLWAGRAFKTISEQSSYR